MTSTVDHDQSGEERTVTTDVASPPPFRYLDGNFAPVADETTAVDLEVTGTIPSALEGRYLRTGPNPMVADGETYHWFAGTGMIHGVDLRDGGARSYRNRYVRTPEIEAELGGETIIHAAGGWYAGSGNTNVVHHAGQILAITEGSLPYVMSPDLETLGTTNFGGPLPGGINAHPKFDPVTNELHAASYGFEAPYLRYHVVDASGRLRRTEEVEMGGPVMVHDIGFSESRVVFFDLPVVFNLELAMAGVSLPFRWEQDYHSRVGVMPRAGHAADTVWIDVDPCFVYHSLNAYDVGDELVMDLVVHPRAFDDARGDFSQGTSTLHRWTIDLREGTLRDELVDDRNQEFPRGDERRAGVRRRFGFTVGASSLDALGGVGAHPTTSLLKHDLDAGTTTCLDLGPGRIASEHVFVPASATAGEDEGWLMGYVFDAGRGASDLVIVDAHDFGGDPVATVHLPVRVPQGFHGNWFPDTVLDRT